MSDPIPHTLPRKSAIFQDATLATGILILLAIAFHWDVAIAAFRRARHVSESKNEIPAKAQRDIRWHAFLEAIHSGDAAAMDKLFQEDPSLINRQQGEWLVNYASHEGTPASVEYLLKQDLEMTLAAAVLLNRRDLIPELIKKNPDALLVANLSEKGNRFWETPLILAIRLDQEETVKLLIKHGSDVNETATGTPPLQHAIRTKNPKMLKILLENGGNANAKDGIDRSHLDWAVQDWRKNVPMTIQLVTLLLEHGADPRNVREIKTNGLVSMALDHGESRMLGLLTRNGVDVNFQDSDRRTFLHHALHAKKDRRAMVQILLEAKPDLALKDRWERNALDLAEELGDPESISLLRQAGAKPTPKIVAQSKKEKAAPGKTASASSEIKEPAPPADPELESERKRLSGVWHHLGLGQNLGLRRTKTTDPYLLDLSDPLGASQKVKDFSPLKDMKIETLLLSKTEITDLSPLKGMPLRRLDLSGTPVEDLTPLEGMKMYHLNIADTQVTDLTFLKNMTVNELVFTPKKISKGMELLKTLPNLWWIGENPERLLSRDEFWKRRQKGEGATELPAEGEQPVEE